MLPLSIVRFEMSLKTEVRNAGMLAATLIDV